MRAVEHYPPETPGMIASATLIETAARWGSGDQDASYGGGIS